MRNRCLILFTLLFLSSCDEHSIRSQSLTCTIFKRLEAEGAFRGFTLGQSFEYQRAIFSEVYKNESGRYPSEVVLSGVIPCR